MGRRGGGRGGGGGREEGGGGEGDGKNLILKERKEKMKLKWFGSRIKFWILL